MFLTVQSSEQDAMMLSLNGFHLMSKTGPVCPVTRLALKSRRPVCNIEKNYYFYSINTEEEEEVLIQ